MPEETLEQMAERLRNQGTEGEGSGPSKTPAEILASLTSGDDKGEKGGKTPAPEVDTNVPWNKDKRFTEFLKQKEEFGKKVEVLNTIMKDNDVEDLDELRTLLTSGKKVVGKVDVEALDSLLAKAEKLDRYEDYWAQQAELEKRKGEEPDATVARLAREKEVLEGKLRQKEQAESTQQVIATFERAASSAIQELFPTADPHEQEFMKVLLGIGNTAIDADVNDKLATNRAIKGVLKRLETHDEKVIKNYLEGKSGVPKVPRSGEDAIQQPEGIKNMKDARAAMKAVLLGR